MKMPRNWWSRRYKTKLNISNIHEKKIKLKWTIDGLFSKRLDNKVDIFNIHESKNLRIKRTIEKRFHQPRCSIIAAPPWHSLFSLSLDPNECYDFGLDCLGKIGRDFGLPVGDPHYGRYGKKTGRRCAVSLQFNFSLCTRVAIRILVSLSVPDPYL